MYPPRHSDIATRRAFPIVTLPLDRDGSTVASPALRDSVDDLRAKYEYAIVDAAPMLKSRLAILLAGIVDGILVTVRLGRTSDADDAALVATLQRVDASVLGVVAAAPKDVDAFAGSSDSHHQNDYIAPMLPASALEHTRFPAFEARPR